MAWRPRIDEESVFLRWMGIEAARLRQGLVEDRKRLSVLLAEEEPQAVTRAGEPYRFDTEVIERFGEQVPPALHRRLRLPITFRFSPDVPGSCYLNDEAAVQALQALGEISELRRLHDGKLWVGRAIAYAIARKYPTAVQFALG
ncbi:MAG TPA: DUF61 family protein [Methanoculleus sp.]|nr:DUF61 family protein [Methanoculleus sp.]